MKKIYDALIIGSGAAGYAAADRLYNENITDIAILTENRLWGTSRNTGSDKQTYYKVSLDGFSRDSAYKMASDICAAGSCDGVKAYMQAVNSIGCFLHLCDYGVNFPTDEFGGYPGYKTDHDCSVRASSAGPLTSKAMTQKLENAVLNEHKTPLFDNRQVIRIITEGGAVSGVTALNTLTGKAEAFYARNVIAATGAPSCVYADSVYPHSQHGMTGVLLEAGAGLCNFSQWQYGIASTDFRWNVSGSYMQVIPRFVSVDSSGEEREFLPDYFENSAEANNNVFLKGYQWPFSVENMNASSRVDLAVYEQTKLGRRVYLDFTKNPSGFSLESLSPLARDYLEKTAALGSTPFKRLSALNAKAVGVYSRQGIDLGSQKLAVAVCAQHNNGGIYTDRNCQSDISGLYVIGEAAGSFGLARPGGSALNDTQTGGLICAKSIKRRGSVTVNENAVEAAAIEQASLLSRLETDESVNYSYIKEKMSDCAAFLRDKEKCRSLLCEVEELLKNYPLRHASASRYFYDRDMLISAGALLQTILGEMPLTGSRGGAAFFENGKMLPENTEYRKQLTVTHGKEIYFEKALPVPIKNEPFEKYLNSIEEDAL